MITAIAVPAVLTETAALSIVASGLARTPTEIQLRTQKKDRRFKRGKNKFFGITDHLVSRCSLVTQHKRINKRPSSSL